MDFKASFLSFLGKSFLNCNGNDWVVGTERFPAAKAPNAASPLTAKLDAMQLLMELNKKSNLKDISADQLRTVSEQLGKVLPTATQQQPQQQPQPTMTARTTNGNVPHASGGKMQTTTTAMAPPSAAQQQHSIGINGRKIAVPVKKGKNVVTTGSSGASNVNHAVSTAVGQPQPTPSSNGVQQRHAATSVSAAKNAKATNVVTSANYNVSGSKMSKMSPSTSSSSMESSQSSNSSLSTAKTTMAPSLSGAPTPSKVTPSVINNNNNNNAGQRGTASLTNGVPSVAKQQNGNAAAAFSAAKEKLPAASVAPASGVSSATAALPKVRTTNPSNHPAASTKLSTAVSTQQRSVSVGRGTSAANATKTTATSTASLPVPPNSPSRHGRNAAPVNGSVNIAAANLAANRWGERLGVSVHVDCGMHTYALLDLEQLVFLI